MCEALRVLMADELNEERVEGQREGQIRAYATLVKDGIITVEVGAEKAGMSVDDFTKKWKGSEQTMCEALRVLMADELNEERVEGQREGQIRAYATLVKDGIITVEVGAEKAGMSVDDFTKEMKQAGYVIPAV